MGSRYRDAIGQAATAGRAEFRGVVSISATDTRPRLPVRFQRVFEGLACRELLLCPLAGRHEIVAMLSQKSWPGAFDEILDEARRNGDSRAEADIARAVFPTRMANGGRVQLPVELLEVPFAAWIRVPEGDAITLYLVGRGSWIEIWSERSWLGYVREAAIEAGNHRRQKATRCADRGKESPAVAVEAALDEQLR